jgi:predicted nuclease of predicted toxin-antitoxin system
MRFLANENFPGPAVDALRQAGHDVLWARTEMPGQSDPEILDRAQQDRRVLITFDKDFGELAFRAGLPAECGIVLFRISIPSPEVAARGAPYQSLALEPIGPESSP